MERLTEHEERYYGETFKTRQMCYMGFDGDCKYDTCCGCTILAMYRKLAHLEDLQEQGRLVELPCRVGAPIWHIDVSIEPNDKGKWVTRCRIKATKFEYSVLDWIDTPIYFTQAEAQAALEGMEGQK